MINFKVSTKYSSNNNIISLKKKKIIKSNSIKKDNDNHLISEIGSKKSLNNSSQLSFIKKKEKNKNINEINYKLMN